MESALTDFQMQTQPISYSAETLSYETLGEALRLWQHCISNSKLYQPDRTMQALNTLTHIYMLGNRVSLRTSLGVLCSLIDFRHLKI